MCKVDGKRRRRTADEARRRWYALHRSRRFARRLWGAQTCGQ